MTIGLETGILAKQKERKKKKNQRPSITKQWIYYRLVHIDIGAA